MRHDVSSMLDAFFSSAVLGGDNKVECTHCHARTEHTQSRVLTKSPEHLLCTIKRFSYDWRRNKALKSLMDVHFGPTIRYIFLWLMWISTLFRLGVLLLHTLGCTFDNFSTFLCFVLQFTHDASVRCDGRKTTTCQSSGSCGTDETSNIWLVCRVGPFRKYKQFRPLLLLRTRDRMCGRIGFER